MALRVLVVCDNPADSRIAAAVLKNAGFDIKTAHSGTAALAFLREQPGSVDVMISSVSIQGLDCVRLAIHAREIAPDLPVIFIRRSIANVGPDGLVRRAGFNTDELVSAIRNVSRQRRAPAAAPSRRDPAPAARTA